MPPKAELTYNFFTLLSTTYMDTENATGAGGFQKTGWATTNNNDFYHKPHLTPK
jgi:hypothetical protein